MKHFMDEEFLLDTQTARELYHGVAEKQPIMDYHCHVSPKEIAENRSFANLTQLWLEGDHYKWRLMRACGVPERLITGDAPDQEKFRAWAATLERAVGNPIYHWSHLELKRYFGFDGYLTSDDPADDLCWHEQLAADDTLETVVLPAFRPDKAVNLEKPDFADYIAKLSQSAGTEIQNMDTLLAALEHRMDYFAAHGCTVADHGLDNIVFRPADTAALDAILQKRLTGLTITEEELWQYKTALLLYFGRGYARRGWVMQLHFAAQRNNNTRMFRQLGPDTGYDSIGPAVNLPDLARLLDTLEAEEALPKTILYSLDPNDNAALVTLMGCYQGEGVRSKLQHGSAWWFNDCKDGMEAQLKGLAAGGVLGNFVGMLTDSRSFLSYTRHEYFRRILCGLLGRWVEEGQYPDDRPLLEEMVADICYRNSVSYFGFQHHHLRGYEK